MSNIDDRTGTDRNGHNPSAVATVFAADNTQRAILANHFETPVNCPEDCRIPATIRTKVVKMIQWAEHSG
jgi:hypothetical protein